MVRKTFGSELMVLKFLTKSVVVGTEYLDKYEYAKEFLEEMYT